MRTYIFAISILGLTACGSAPEPTDTPEIYTGMAENRVPVADEAPVEPSSSETMLAQEGESSQTEAEAEPMAAPAGDVVVAPVPEGQTVAEPVSEVVETAPPEITVEFLDSLVNQVHLDIRWGRRDIARDRIADVLGRVELEDGDSRSGMVTRLRALDGFLAARGAQESVQGQVR